MRLWSLHPSYLDSKGLVALWREGLLAQKVLQGRTRGYRHHSQLKRFQELEKPEVLISNYLIAVSQEAILRGYNFDARKIAYGRSSRKIVVTSGQLEYELSHLRRKLWRRDRFLYWQIAEVKRPKCHPLFSIKPGFVEDWEVV